MTHAEAQRQYQAALEHHRLVREHTEPWELDAWDRSLEDLNAAHDLLVRTWLEWATA